MIKYFPFLSFYFLSTFLVVQRGRRMVQSDEQLRTLAVQYLQTLGPTDTYDSSPENLNFFLNYLFQRSSSTTGPDCRPGKSDDSDFRQKTVSGSDSPLPVAIFSGNDFEILPILILNL